MLWPQTGRPARKKLEQEGQSGLGWEHVALEPAQDKQGSPRGHVRKLPRAGLAILRISWLYPVLGVPTLQGWSWVPSRQPPPLGDL